MGSAHTPGGHQNSHIPARGSEGFDPGTQQDGIGVIIEHALGDAQVRSQKGGARQAVDTRRGGQ
jgi:hypothetical protein